MQDHSIQIRKLSATDLDQYNDLLSYAFQVTQKTLLNSGWERDDIRQSKFPVLERAEVLGCFDNDNLISQFAVYPLEMNINSEIYPIGFITSVSTYPEYSGQGNMSRLMKQSLVDMKERRQSLALLYPFSIPLYRHRGWEIICDKMTYRVRDVQLPRTVDAPGYIRRVDEDSDDLKSLHTAFAKQTHGCLLRNHLAWEEYWRWDEEDINIAIYYSSSHRPLGYMVYLLKEDIMYIKEMIYLNSEARRGLWKYIAAHESMVDEVSGNNYFSEPIAFSLNDSDIKETIRPYIMGRIVDFETFLEKYNFAPEINNCGVTLHVDDPFLEWNNKSFNIDFYSGRGQLVPKASNHQASISIGALTTLLLGYKTAAQLAKLEKLQADEATIKLLDNAIYHEKPYISDYI